MQNYLTMSSQSLYALRVLRSHGLEGVCTLGCHACYAGVKDVVCFPSLVGSAITNSSYSNDYISLLSKLQRVGFLPQQFSTFAELCEQAEHGA